MKYNPFTRAGWALLATWLLLGAIASGVLLHPYVGDVWAILIGVATAAPLFLSWSRNVG